jgi:hypothetical protein
MAQTKKSSTSTRPSRSSRSKSTKAKSAKASRPASAKRSRPAAKTRSRSSSSASNGSAGNPVEAVRDTVEEKAKSAGKSVGGAGRTVGRVASKAKLPLVAGGAALAGVAGGVALAGSRRAHRGPVAAALRKPKIKLDSGDVARVAKEVGNFSTQVGALAGELQRNREDAGNGNGNGRHRSPIEVALQGLTSRH